MDEERKAKLPASFVMLMLFCFGGLLAGYAFYEVTPTIYESNASFLVRPTGLKLPVESFDFDSLLNDEHEKSIASPSVIGFALREFRLEDLDSFKKLYSEGDFEKARAKHNAIEKEDRVLDYVISNLVVEQMEDDSLDSRKGALSYELTYSETDAQDAQTVLNGILDAYETRLGEWFLATTGESISSLNELYDTAEASLAHEKAKNASEGVVARLEERLAEIVTQIQTLNFYSDSVTKPRLLKFTVLENATYGMPVYPILHKSLIIGTLAGLLLGIVFLVILGLIKAFKSPDNTDGTWTYTSDTDDNSDVGFNYEIAGSADLTR